MKRSILYSITQGGHVSSRHCGRLVFSWAPWLAPFGCLRTPGRPVHVEMKHVAWNVAWCVNAHLAHAAFGTFVFLSFRLFFFCHRQYSISGRQRAGRQDLVWQLWATTSSTTSSEPVNKRWRPHTQGSVTLVDIDSHTGQDSSPQGETCCLTGGFSFAPPQPPSRVAQ